MFLKNFGYYCPDCGGMLQVSTDCDPKDDNDFETFYVEGDEVNCMICSFTSIISISDDGVAYVD